MKKNRPTDGGGNWMDTYGDMVTLLLCFFVMLYSMSSLNQQKWEVFVRSIYPASNTKIQEDLTVNGVVVDDSEEAMNAQGTPDIPETEAEIDMDTLYLTIAEVMNEMGIDGVTISRGEDYTFIVFQDKTFLDGDSSVLTDMGKQTLDVFCEAISPADELLEQVNIMAHTAQGDPDRPNNPRTDRMLSAMRAAEVCIYVQTKEAIDASKLVNISYGQFRPVADNGTREGRAKNRRVEILLVDEGANVRSMNEYYEEYTSGVNAETTVVTDGQPANTEHGFAPADSSSDQAIEQDGASSLMTPRPEDGADVPPEAEAAAAVTPAPEPEPEPDIIPVQ